MKNKTNINLMVPDTLDQTAIKPIITPKNTWLYPTDAFGLLEKGVAVDSKTYALGIQKNETTIFTIMER